MEAFGTGTISDSLAKATVARRRTAKGWCHCEHLARKAGKRRETRSMPHVESVI